MRVRARAHVRYCMPFVFCCGTWRALKACNAVRIFSFRELSGSVCLGLGCPTPHCPTPHCPTPHCPTPHCTPHPTAPHTPLHPTPRCTCCPRSLLRHGLRPRAVDTECLCPALIHLHASLRCCPYYSILRRAYPPPANASQLLDAAITFLANKIKQSVAAELTVGKGMRCDNCGNVKKARDRCPTTRLPKPAKRCKAGQSSRSNAAPSGGVSKASRCSCTPVAPRPLLYCSHSAVGPTHDPSPCPVGSLPPFGRFLGGHSLEPRNALPRTSCPV